MNKYGVGLIILLTGLWSQEPVILEGGIAEALPDFEELWILPVEGEVMDIEIPEEGSFYYVISSENRIFRLYKISIDGRLLWMRKWGDSASHQYIYGLKTSDNGDIVIVHVVDGWIESVYTKVFDNKGNELFKKNKSNGLFYPSPSGKYLIFSDPNNFSPLKLYDPYGRSPDGIIEIKNKSFLKGKRSTHRFVANDQLLVYKTFEGKGYLYLVTVPEGKLQWSHEFSAPFWLIDFNERNCAYTDQYIALQGTRRPADIYLFDYNGNLIWKIEGLFSNHAISFSSDEKYLISIERGKWVEITDVRNKEKIDRFLIQNPSLENRPQIDLIEDSKLFISQAYAMSTLQEKLGFNTTIYMYYFSYFKNINQIEDENSLYYFNGVLDINYNLKQKKYLIISADNRNKLLFGRVKDVEK